MSALVEKIATQSPHPQVIPIKGLSSSKSENVAYRDEHLNASLSPSDTGSSSMASDAD